MSKAQKFTIRIDSILGGHSPSRYFAAPDQFLASAGIDPSHPADSTDSRSGGILTPTAMKSVSTTVTAAIHWLTFSYSQPAANTLYAYASDGSVYTVGASMTGLSDGGSMSGSKGNGAAYYDNYMYFAKDTTVARYGPLNGTPLFNGDYWVTTLGKTALSSDTISYPIGSMNPVFRFGNHYMHRHSDGKLYFADIVDNQAVIHVISTTKTTVEGDTNDNSTYARLTIGRKLGISAIGSYGNQLVIGLYEGSGAGKYPARIAFWDTTSDKINQITLNEFPDPLITSFQNVNGELFIISGNPDNNGFRLSRFIGGYSVEELFFSKDSSLPLQGATGVAGSSLLFGSVIAEPEELLSVYSYNLQQPQLGNGIFNIASAAWTPVGTYQNVTAIAVSEAELRQPIIAWLDNPTFGVDYLNSDANDFGHNTCVWWSQVYRIGRPFKITKIRIPLANAISNGVIITPKIYTDNDGTTFTLQTINNTNYSGKRSVVFKSSSSGETITGQNDFHLELRWTGNVKMSVSLPIIIEYELIDE
jgi:hypothetical protein